MSLGSCLLSNQTDNLADALLQDRINGLSWQEIADKYNLGSPGAARTAFKKLTGITDFKIKGKELQDVISKGLIDDLKKATPKVPKAPKLAKSNIDDVVEGQTGGTAFKAPQVYEGHPTVKSFKNKVVSDNVENAGKNIHNLSIQFGDDLTEVLHNNGAKTLAQLNKLTGIPIPDLDQWMFWRQVSIDAGDIWKAYIKRPTSFTGFDEVQKMYWRYKHAGIGDSFIEDMTGIPKGVQKLISTGDWTVATPGSTTFVGYQAPNFSSTSYSYSSSYELKGETGVFNEMYQSEVDVIVSSYGHDLNSTQISVIRRYTGSYYGELNGALRTGTATSGHIHHAEQMSQAMRPLPRDVTLHRGVHSSAFPGGKVPDVGDAYVDKGFMSTSYGDRAAFSGKEIQLVLDCPAGTPARAITNLSGYGNAEREIIIDRGVRWVVTGTKQTGPNRWTVYMRAVP